ncbi:MAG: phosphate acyltransferase PlsX [Thermodesulfobacteriota bacterium]
MIIGLDAMGSDFGPAELLAGAVQAAEQTGVRIAVAGDEPLIREALAGASRKAVDLIDIIPASQVVTMADSPSEALRNKKDSSIAVLFELQKDGKIDAVVSAGNSGAVLASAIKYLGRLNNIARPGIASVFPTLQEPVVMMDVGANVDCRPQHLLEFGIMSAAYYSIMFGNPRPRVGMLSIGKEIGKGNHLVKEARKLLQASSLNFIGNVEGGDTFQGNVDVIVCDGFVGNICLKLSEGLAEVLFKMLKDEIKGSVSAKMGCLFAKNAFKNFKKRIDYAEYGGAPLLGMNGISLICHGKSERTAIKNAIQEAFELVSNKVNDHILTMLHGDEYRKG